MQQNSIYKITPPLHTGQRFLKFYQYLHAGTPGPANYHPCGRYVFGPHNGPDWAGVGPLPLPQPNLIILEAEMLNIPGITRFTLSTPIAGEIGGRRNRRKTRRVRRS